MCAQFEESKVDSLHIRVLYMPVAGGELRTCCPSSSVSLSYIILMTRKAEQKQSIVHGLSLDFKMRTQDLSIFPALILKGS